MNVDKATNDITLEWALHYAEHGYRVIPIKPKEKRPPMGAWQDVATTQTGTIRAWWEGTFHNYGIGIVTGALDNGTRFFVLDIDEHDPKASGTNTIALLEQRNSPLPDTISARTGSGGHHRLYRLADHHPEIGNGAGRMLGAGVDVRAINAQIVVAPTIHPNGNAYEWVKDHAIGEIEMATAPDWLIDMLTPAPHTTTTVATPAANTSVYDERAGTRFNRSTEWDTLLSNDGWTPHHADGIVKHWTRPGKNTRDGTSATVNYNGNDSLTVFTTSINNLPVGSYDRFGYWTQTRHNGDFKDAARTLNIQNDDQITAWIDTIQKETPPQLDIAQPKDSDPLSTWYVDWQQLWSTEQQQSEWMLEPILARGRAHALYAGAKSGKSLLLLELAAALATGQPVLKQQQREPIEVLYVDYEMTAADIRDRLEAFGYNADSNMQHLHYVLLPSIAGLDTKAGADIIIAAVAQKKIQLVIIDTTARAVEGEENDADTLRAFYRWTGVALKSQGVTWVRADHAGKDSSKGQRGSSAKNDDVDVVWKFTKRNTTSILLEATHRRMQWIPDKIELELRERDGILAHHIVGDEISDAAMQLVDTLKQLDAPIDISTRSARDLLRRNNIKSASDILRAALRVYKMRISSDRIEVWVEQANNTSGTYRNNDGTYSNGTTVGTPAPNTSTNDGTSTAHDGTLSSGTVPNVPRSKERHIDSTSTEPMFDEIF